MFSCLELAKVLPDPRGQECGPDCRSAASEGQILVTWTWCRHTRTHVSAGLQAMLSTPVASQQMPSHGIHEMPFVLRKQQRFTTLKPPKRTNAKAKALRELESSWASYPAVRCRGSFIQDSWANFAAAVEAEGLLPRGWSWLTRVDSAVSCELRPLAVLCHWCKKSGPEIGARDPKRRRGCRGALAEASQART